jgi:LIVCS family branched-chain amino acid:cation transporter
MRLSAKQIIFVSLMLFSMFFGAGNLIFPPFLGQEAGEHLWPSIVGFILSAAGLPILGVVAVAKAGSFHTLNSRVHPLFALIFPFIIYIAIGPGLAIPRAGSLAFEMGAAPFLPENMAVSPIALFIHSIIFFGLVLWLSMFPSKLVDLFGKLLSPILLALILIIFIKSLIVPMGAFETPKGNYEPNPVFQGFLDGYLTMDALGALVFGIVISNTLTSLGIVDRKKQSLYMVYVGVGAGLLLMMMYLILGYLGASSFGESENGAQILSNVMTHLFGQSGTLLLGLVFTLACFCVSIGLVTSCGQFFASAITRINYKMWVIILCVLSTAITNLGLTQILTISVPILGMIYPIAIVLIILALCDDLIKGNSYIYSSIIGFVGFFSILDMINKTFLTSGWNNALTNLPFYTQGMGWILPAVIGGGVGYVVSRRNAGFSSPKTNS